MINAAKKADACPKVVESNKKALATRIFCQSCGTYTNK
ncbi:MAG TPA: hypothetical protein ENJ39_05705 [Flammeovirgaceae bacterium]|nr:hypothetical protein [Flammeovirgaceae bacterium]